MSSALREKSGVLFRCNQSHQHASDVFEEFCHQAHMPHKSFQCNRDMNVSQLMQVINGAAMAKFWVFFEHLDNLPLVHFQIVVKEIQMVQQQYIIAELSDRDIMQDGNLFTSGIHIDENKAMAKESLGLAGTLKHKPVETAAMRLKTPPGPGGIMTPLTGLTRPSLGIFGSLASGIQIKNPGIAENLNLQAQSAFRTISLAKPNTLALVKMLLKSEGFQHYDKLGRIVERFINDFTKEKNDTLYGKGHDELHVEQITEKLVVRDVKIAVRLSILLRDQEWSGYKDAIFKRQQKQWRFELQLYEKTMVEKEAEEV
jgi:hypothetical protein